jgi:hypothetical protein
LFVLAFILGWIVPGPVVKQKDDEIKRLQRLIEEELIPMAKRYAETMALITPALDKVMEALRRLGDRDGS